MSVIVTITVIIITIMFITIIIVIVVTTRWTSDAARMRPYQSRPWDQTKIFQRDPSLQWTVIIIINIHQR